MQIVIWLAFLMLAAIWTGGVALTVAIIRWSAGLLQSADGGAALGAFGAIPIPAWLAPFVDLTGWREMLQWGAALWESLRSALPMLGHSLDWLVPIAWIVWGIGLVGLLVLTLIGSKFMSKLIR